MRGGRWVRHLIITGVVLLAAVWAFGSQDAFALVVRSAVRSTVYHLIGGFW